MHAWVNGQMLTDPRSPAILVTDHGLTVGDGVFEAIKVVDGQPFALTRHLERLGRSAAALGPAGSRSRQLRGAVADVLAQEPLALGRIRITYTGGPAPLGSGRGDAAATTVVVAAPMDPAPRTDRGRVGAVAAQRARSVGRA